MECMENGCHNEALDDSNFCSIHRPGGRKKPGILMTKARPTRMAKKAAKKKMVKKAAKKMVKKAAKKR